MNDPEVGDGNQSAGSFHAFQADVSAAGDARQFVRSHLADVTPDVSFVAELLVDELVTNAVVHVHSPVVVELKAAAGMVQVEVSDFSDELPLLAEPMEGDDHGRGLPMVRDMSDEWGVTPNESGKTVWFRLSGPS